MKPRSFRIPLLASALFASSPPAHAATSTWTGTTNGTWDTTTAANWGGTAFTSSNNALFTGTPTNNVTTATGLTIGTITLDSTFTGSVTMSGPNTVSGATTISGGTLNLNHQTGLGSSAVTVNSGGTVNVTLGADQNVNNIFTGTGVLTVGGGTGTPNFNNASALNGFTGTFNVNTTGGKKVALTTAGGKIGSGATVNITSGGTLYIANTTASFDGVTFNVVGSGNTEGFGALRIENGSVIGATSSVVLGGDTSLGAQNGSAATINAAIGQTTASALTKVGNQTLVLGGNNSYTGATILTAGTLSVSSDSAGAYNLGGSGANGIIFNGGTLQVTGTTMTNFGSHTPTFTATKTVGIDIANAANNFTVSQALNQTTGLLVKTGSGTLTLSGANTYSGGTRANAGTTVLAGSQTGGSWLSLNNVGAQNAVVKITSGAGTLAFTADLNEAEATNARGAIYQEGGTFAFGNGVKIGNGTTSYGYYKLSSGTLTNTAGDMGVGMGSGATGVMDVTGGSVSTGSWIVLGRNGAGNGLLNVTGGSVTSNSNNIALNWANTAGSISILNIGGGVGAATVTGVSNAGNYFDVTQSNTAGTTGVANLLSNGTLTVAKVQGSNGGSTGLFNFNGGTLKATAANAGANFMTSGNVDAVTVYSGGGTIDNNGTIITIGNVLSSATGNGITSIAVTDGGSGYIGAPLVKFTGGTGNTATGYAVMADDGTGNGTFKVSSVVITSGGTYTDTTGLSVAFSGGGASTAATPGAITTAANTSGGMAFQGSGITKLTGANTFSGGTTISQGTVGIASANGTNTNLGSGSVTINANGTLRVGYGVSSNQNISTTANNISLNGGTIYADDANQHLTGNVTVSGSSGTLGSTYNAGNNTAAERDKGLALDGIVSGSGALTVQHTRINTGNNYDTSFVSFSNNSNTYSGTITINQNTTSAEGGVYLGVNGNSALQNATVVTSDIPGTNRRFGSSPIVFKTGLGSATIGAIGGSGALVLTGYDQVNHAYGADSISLTVGGNNASTSYSGVISGGGSLNKSGSGTTTLSGANTYTGKTTVSGGVLALGSGGSIANSSEIALNGGNFNISAVSDYSTGTSQALTGSGSVTGNITVNGTLAIGNSPGTMTFNNDLTIGSSAISDFEFTHIALGLGSYDLAESGTGSQTVTFGGTLNLIFSGGTYADNSSVQIFDFENYDGDFTTVNFSGLGEGQSAVFNASTGFVTVVPEPGAALLGGLGMLALLRRRRN